MATLSDLKKRNEYAIRMLDNREVKLARRLFIQNYRSQRTPMTIINLAAFWVDEHAIICQNAICRRIQSQVRAYYAKKILIKGTKDILSDKQATYHLYCLMGRIGIIQRNFNNAILHYSKAKQIEPYSVEVLSMLAWLSVLQHDNSAAYSCLELLSQILKLGPDIATNLETIFEECPFIRFPFYQLLVYVLSSIDNDRAQMIFHRMIDQNEPLFPAEESVLLCLYLKNYSCLDSLMNAFLAEPTNNEEKVNAIVFSLKDNQKCSPIVKPYIATFSQYSSVQSKVIYSLKRRKADNDLEYVLQTFFYPISKECHFIDCPIHDKPGE